MTAISPSICDLAEVAISQPPDFQTRYLDPVEHLDFTDEECRHHLLFEHYRFPNLRTISLAFSGYNNDFTLVPYLQPKLERLHFYGGPITDATLARLLTCCPVLRELIIENPLYTCCSSEGFRMYLDGVRSLSSLELRCGKGDAAIANVFLSLAQSSILRTLDFRITIDVELMSRALEDRRRLSNPNPSLFADLKKLVCVATYPAITMLLPHLTKLTYLEVSIKGKEALDLFSQLCRFRLQLRVLKIEYLCSYPVMINPAMMLEFVQKRCWDIEELVVSGKEACGTGFSRPVFKLLERAGSLRHLRLSLKCDLTEVTLLVAAKYAGKRLVELDIHGTFDSDRLTKLFADMGFSFGKQFRFLSIGTISIPRFENDIEELRPKAEAFAHLLKTIFPMLEDFNVSDSNDFSKMVESELMEMLEDARSIYQKIQMDPAS
ncbi:uncharacterized protein GGS22DRAFT_192719 [Annulohypoxylon maeteangense]|uniref:uncharacterized protein n=1 Tax=Annulohypoxylon maeteangense TaxID=1927788 RepID=UPI002008E079|nr:uncharacterized protein GGS22DRAFT_192719 [Annulohypoxylon maeteangense]KAI0880883.1 hypothetical protein GGS22DRAFT_192719 [Annulohypoxylon maeteangense]